MYIIHCWIHPHLKKGCDEVHILFDDPHSLDHEKPSSKDIERCRRDSSKRNKINVNVYDSLSLKMPIPKEN